MLNLTKVAVGCPDVATLAARQREHWGDAAASLTRMMPKRADELVGGSLFWIIAHRLVARQTILRLAMVDTEWGRKCRIDLAPFPVAVVPRTCRAHQGWRYLAAADAPPDLAGTGSEVMPADMAHELAALGLL
ncbi:hypothetical protein IP88_13900 [alpha proteobacterium AAP81b]|nr:hypothetical protein IP88_13900 [alpha proteobacterium AAP81b]